MMKTSCDKCNRNIQEVGRLLVVGSAVNLRIRLCKECRERYKYKTTNPISEEDLLNLYRFIKKSNKK